jgi:hypothetical protein
VLAGFGFLGLGFLSQAFPAFGVDLSDDPSFARVASLVTLAIASNVASIAYEVLVRLFFEQQRYVRRELNTTYEDVLRWARGSAMTDAGGSRPDSGNQMRSCAVGWLQRTTGPPAEGDAQGALGHPFALRDA